MMATAATNPPATELGTTGIAGLGSAAALRLSDDDVADIAGRD